MITITYYQVEAKFHGREWQRNEVRHETVELAEAFRKHFIKIAETRIVMRTESEEETIVCEN